MLKETPLPLNSRQMSSANHDLNLVSDELSLDWQCYPFVSRAAEISLAASFAEGWNPASVSGTAQRKHKQCYGIILHSLKNMAYIAKHHQTISAS